ncbi:NAD-dependent succinate-semialdehyde dehydrogenase [Marinicauda pacifica]|uniref:NAD-dependent succinate-semialdehyde dehydrogenase n=1 Tax=Marinicauda pacifica TaxID=1133559 RepID=A0A4S2HF64_9PROT|nr:NAD-dependent succinate-semialdehyde dehydrogenase [Marinicauda pacifica]TGY94292.1 NAD-dependent succinate-semialdehyde dehydrogenase [Marinicauda pacifica]GGE34659.1 NAD-dependent succinate-semialdehyde dehydrogenase [Marinicauda pacifica]
MSDLKQRLSDPGLFRTESYVDGKWVSGETRFQVSNPANREIIAEVCDVGEAGAREAVAAAHDAFARWKKTSVFERARLVQRWHELIMEHVADLGTLITAEMGKPLKEARGEVAYGASFVKVSAEEATRLHGETMATQFPGTRGWTIRQPVGVVGCITPWNFPSAMITRKCAPALAAGCTMVVKPAPETPLSALALAELAERAGIPKGVFNVICGDATKIGPVLTGSPEVAMIGFTGSTEIGKLLMRQAADGVKRVSLELGGNAPFIVMDDADIEKAADGVLASKFRAGGQTCVSANRIIVQEGIADRLAEALKARIEKVKVGSGFDDGVDVGPLIHDEAVTRVGRLVENAREQGASILAGGRSLADELGGSFYAPTLISGGHAGLDIARNEIFGPVASLYRARDEAEILRLANDTPFGLAAYVYTRDIGRVHRITEGLDYGMVGVNAPMVGSSTTPFGGVKESGIGREGGKWGVEEFTELKFVMLGDVE